MSAPVKKYQSGAINLAIWENKAQTANGERTFYSVTFDRRYKDNKTDEWKSTNSLRENDIPKLKMLLDKAYEYINLKDDVSSSSKQETEQEYA